jgi:hypothetical protein
MALREPTTSTQTAPPKPTKPATYAAAVKKKAAPSKIKRLAARMTAPREAPLQFQRLHIRVSDTRPLKMAATRQEKQKLIQAFLKHQDMRKSVFIASPIGNSIIEVYVRQDHLAQIQEKLDKDKIRHETIDLVKPAAYPGAPALDYELLVKRLGWLYYHARLSNLRAAILEDLPQQTQDAICTYVPPYKAKATNSGPVGTSSLGMEVDSAQTAAMQL